MEDSGDDVVFITVEEFSDEQWAEIHTIAELLRKKGAFQGDPLKCAVKAVIFWLANKDELAVGIAESEAKSLDRKTSLH